MAPEGACDSANELLYPMSAHINALLTGVMPNSLAQIGWKSMTHAALLITTYYYLLFY